MTQGQDEQPPILSSTRGSEPAGDDDSSPERFLQRFNRVASGLDPGQVYSYFMSTVSRMRQLEEQAAKVSAPFLIESALRDAAEIRTQASQTAERAYNAIVKAAEEQATALRSQAQAALDAAVEQGSAAIVEAKRQADELLAEAGEEAAQVRSQARLSLGESERELERLCGELAALLQRMAELRAGRPPAGHAATIGLSQPEPRSAVVPTDERELDRAAEQAASAPRQFVAAAFTQARIESLTYRPSTRAAVDTQGSHQELAAEKPGRVDRPSTDEEVGDEKQPSAGFKLPSWLDL